MKLKIGMTAFWLYCIMILAACSNGPDENPPEENQNPGDFYFGADLSSANQVLDHGGVYKDGGATLGPYKILNDHGANLARFRLWHNPAWTKEVYGVDGTQLTMI